MDLMGISLEGWTDSPLARVVALTIFYALLCYIPLRCGTAIYGWLTTRRERKKREAVLKSIHAMRW